MIQFITYKGTRILYIDLAGLGKDDVLVSLRQGRALIDREPKNSLLTLTDVSNGDESRDTRNAIKDFATLNKPYVRMGAVVGITGLKKLTFNTLLVITGRRNLSLFDDLETARDWLTTV